jgi:predicted MFS family arabinose efflux permease
MKTISSPRFALAVLLAVNLLNFFDRQLPGSLGEPIRREFGLSDTALGFLGTVFTLFYAAVGLPAGRLSDRWVRTRLIAIGVAVWSLLTAASGLARSYSALFVTRLGVGLGEATCAPASLALLGDLYPPQKRGRALAVFMLGLPLGLFLAYVVSGYLGQALGWRRVFLLACIPGLFTAVLALMIKEPVRGAADHGPAALTPHPAPFRAVLAIPTMIWIIASGALHNFNMYAINAFQTPFLQRFHQLDLKQANMVSAIVLGAVGVAGLLFGGWAGDRLRERRANGRLLLAAMASLLTAPCVLAALAQPKGALLPFMLLMGTGGTMMYVYYATVYASIQDVIEPRLRGTAVALYFFAQYVLGASLGPMGTGMLSDRFARQAMAEAGSTVLEPFRAAGLHQAMYVIPVLATLAGLALFAGARTIAADVQRRQAAASL